MSTTYTKTLPRLFIQIIINENTNEKLISETPIILISTSPLPLASIVTPCNLGKMYNQQWL